MNHNQKNNEDPYDDLAEVDFLNSIKRGFLYLIGISKKSPERKVLNKKRWYRAIKAIWILIIIGTLFGITYEYIEYTLPKKNT